MLAVLSDIAESLVGRSDVVVGLVQSGIGMWIGEVCE